MSELFIVLASIFAYTVITGFISTKFYHTRRCLDVCGHDHEFSAFFTGLFWPLAVPFIIGGASSKFSLNDFRDNRRKHEIEEAKHRAELAEIRAQETEALERALRS